MCCSRCEPACRHCFWSTPREIKVRVQRKTQQTTSPEPMASTSDCTYSVLERKYKQVGRAEKGRIPRAVHMPHAIHRHISVFSRQVFKDPPWDNPELHRLLPRQNHRIGWLMSGSVFIACPLSLDDWKGREMIMSPTNRKRIHKKGKSSNVTFLLGWCSQIRLRLALTVLSPGQTTP